MNAPVQSASGTLAPPPIPPPAAVATRPRRLGSSTPARIRLLSTVSAVLAVFLGLFGWIAVGRRADALDDARDAAARLIAVQEIRSAVIEADSIATTSFLVGGLESADQRARYELRLATAASQTADQGLDDVSATLTTVAGLVEQARANNRQGFPVGAAYQRQASSVVRDDLLPALDAIEAEARADVNDAVASAHRIGWVVPFAGFVVVAALVGGSWWLFQRTNRLVNVPIALALGTVLIAVFATISSMSGAVRAADDVVTGSLVEADQLSQARVAAYQARSDEALTLINRGNGQANEDAYQQSVTVAETILDRRRDDLAQSFSEYTTVHGAIRDLDNGGNWEGAVALLIGDSADDFAVATDDIEAVVDSQSAEAAADLDDAGSSLPTSRWILVIGALLAAGLITAGYSQRLKEYR